MKVEKERFRGLKCSPTQLTFPRKETNECVPRETNIFPQILFSPLLLFIPNKISIEQK